MKVVTWLRELYPSESQDAGRLGVLGPDRLAGFHTVTELGKSEELARRLWVPKTRATWTDDLQSPIPRPAPGSRSWPVWTCDDLRLVGLKLIFLVVSSAMSLLRLSRRESWWKDAEILMLRHQLAVAQRQRPRVHVRLTWPDRAWLALLARTLPIDRLAGMRLIVTPATILRWHRDVVRRRWARLTRQGRSGRPATHRNVRAVVLQLVRENESWG
jgi:hypothetical protein